MFIIPNQETKRHLQTNTDDVSGSIYRSRNINLDENGYISLAPASVAVMTTEDNSNLDSVDAMYPSDNAIIFNSDEVFEGTINFGTISDDSGDTNRPTPSVEDDCHFLNDVEIVSDGTLIKYKSGASTWTTVSLSSFSASFPIAMTSWETEGVLAVGNNNLVKFVKQDWSVHATILTLPPDYQVSSLAVQGAQLFIGTRSKSGGEAKMFVVSTIQVGIDYAYGVGTFEIMSVKPFKSSVALVTSLGQLLRFNGGGFDVLAVLPIYKTEIEWCDALNDYSTVSNRAMTVDGDLIYINLSSITQDGRYVCLPDFPSGVWCYDDSNQSLYHRHAPSLSTIQKIDGSNVTVDTGANDFTLTSGNLDNVVTGMPVMYMVGSTAIPELREAQSYFIIKNSSTEFQLATSYDNAIASTAIDITGAGDTGQDFYIIKTCDYGWTYYDNRMAISVLNNRLFTKSLAGRLAFTADLTQKQATTSNTVINGIAPYIPNRGYFVTPRLNSTNIEDEYNNIYVKHSPLGPDDKIIIKAKSIDKYDYPFSSVQFQQSSKYIGTWSDTDTFTTTADLSSVVEGDEIEIISGVGAGHIAFVSSISESTGTYTVNLDETFPFVNASDLMKFNVDNFEKIGEITSSTQKSTNDYRTVLGKKSKFVQIKIELRGIKTKVEEVIINNKVHKPVI